MGLSERIERTGIPDRRYGLLFLAVLVGLANDVHAAETRSRVEKDTVAHNRVGVVGERRQDRCRTCEPRGARASSWASAAFSIRSCASQRGGSAPRRRSGPRPPGGPARPFHAGTVVAIAQTRVTPCADAVKHCTPTGCPGFRRPWCPARDQSVNNARPTTGHEHRHRGANPTTRQHDSPPA